MSHQYPRSFSEGSGDQWYPANTTLFSLAGSACFFLGILGFAADGSEDLHFNCDPGKREVFWALQLEIVLVPGAVFKSIKQEDSLQNSFYTVLSLFCFLNDFL